MLPMKMFSRPVNVILKTSQTRINRTLSERANDPVCATPHCIWPKRQTITCNEPHAHRNKSSLALVLQICNYIAPINFPIISRPLFFTRAHKRRKMDGKQPSSTFAGSLFYLSHIITVIYLEDGFLSRPVRRDAHTHTHTMYERWKNMPRSVRSGTTISSRTITQQLLAYSYSFGGICWRHWCCC